MIAFDNNAAGGYVPGNNGTATLSITTGSGSNRALVVSVVEAAKSATISGVTYNGVSMTQIWDQSIASTINYRSFGFILVAPSSGANNIVVTFVGDPSEAGVMASTWTGVNQSTPNRTATTAQLDNGTVAVSVTAANAISGDVVVDGVVGFATGITAGGSQTSLYASSFVGDTTFIGGNSYKAATGSTTMTWTLTAGGYWSIGAVPLIQASSAAFLDRYYYDMIGAAH